MLSLLLRTLGLLLRAGCTFSPRFRAQISRPTVIEIRCRDGAAHHYVFAERRVRSVPGRAIAADAAIVFDTAIEGVRTLLSQQIPRLLFTGLLDGKLAIEGNIYLVLWFYGLVRMVLPLARPPRLAATPPGGYTAHDPNGPVADRITREPAADALDPGWEEAAVARSKLLMIRVDAGGEAPPLF